MTHDTPNKTDAELIERALEALRSSTGIEGRLLNTGGHIDACIELSHRGESHTYLVESKTYIDRTAQIQRVHQQFVSRDTAGILIAPYITRDAAQYCRSIGQQFIDGTGNAYLDTPGLLVFVTGERTNGVSTAPRATKGVNKVGALRVTFALLADTNLVYTKFQNIAEKAQVSLGTVNNTLDDLERRGFLFQKGDAGRRRLLEPLRLLDEWAINFPNVLRPKLLRYQFSAPPELWDEPEIRSMSAVSWGGEAGARLLSRYLKPETLTLYIAPEDFEITVHELAKRYRLRPDPAGNLQVLERFWPPGFELEPGIAPPVVIYSELLDTLDPRARETAAVIREKWIEPSFD